MTVMYENMDSIVPVRPARRGIRRIRRVPWTQLAHGESERWIRDCYAIYREASSTLAADQFAARFFSHPSTRLGAFYGGDGELAGFSNVAVLHVRCGGRIHAVFSAGVYFRLGYRGGDASVLFGLTEAVREKLRAPHLPMAYMSMASSPAPYHLFYTRSPRLWPSPDAETPPADIGRAARAVGEARGLTFASESPWLVHSFVKPDRPQRVRRSQRLRSHRSTAFYERLNPSWDRPDEPTALLVWIPLDLRNITGTLQRTLTRST